MSSRLQLRRVERLERLASDEHGRWLASLTIDELEALQSTQPPLDPALEVLFDELSEAELEWLCSTSATYIEAGRRLHFLRWRRQRLSTPAGHQNKAEPS